MTFTSEKVGGQNAGRPLHFKKSGRNVPLSTHGSTPCKWQSSCRVDTVGCGLFLLPAVLVFH